MTDNNSTRTLGVTEVPITIYLALGTNLGDKEANILRAYELIEEKIGTIIGRSSFYYSKPWGFTSDNDFVNTVICVKSSMKPRILLEATQEIERMMGRHKNKAVTSTACDKTNVAPREYHDRIIDIDILMYGDLCIDEPDLKIPHPLMKERDFVMVPLNELLQGK